VFAQDFTVTFHVTKCLYSYVNIIGIMTTQNKISNLSLFYTFVHPFCYYFLSYHTDLNLGEKESCRNKVHPVYFTHV